MDARKILIIDDNEQDRKIMLRLLTKGGYTEVITADSGEEGLRKARSENPSLIILDVMLPKLDGYRICRMLKFDAKYSNIPVIMLTSLAQLDNEKIGLEVGADMYITKDFESEKLLLKIKQLLDKQE